MNNRRFAASVLALAFVLSGCSPAANFSHRGLACEKKRAEPYCRVSFPALAQDSHRFDGRLIRIEGYLGVSRDQFVLNSSKELYEAGVTADVAIRIRGPLDVQERIFQEHAYSWVSLAGTFRINTQEDRNTDDLLIGEVFAPLEVQSLTFPLEVRRQGFGEVLLDLDDLK